jgi:outer membrane protein assembly factor BamB
MVLFPSVCSAAGYDWPQFHNTPDSAGYSSSSAPNSGDILWTSENIGANASSSPLVAGGRVYVYCCPGSDPFSADSSAITCLDENTGAKLWQTPVDAAKWGSYSSPAYNGGKIFIGSGSKAFCLDAGSGAVLWSYPLIHDVVNGSPRVANGKAYFTDWDPNHGGTCYCYCLNVADGSLLWRHTMLGDSQSTPAYDNGKIYVNTWTYTEGPGTGANNTYCLDAADGHENWLQQGLVYETCGSPAVGGGKVFVVTYNFYGDGELAALDAADGHIVWGPVAIQRTDSTPAYADGKVYVCGGCSGFSDFNTYCLSAETGSQLWKYDGVGNWTCSVAVADGKVFVGEASDDFFGYGGLYALGAGDGHLVWNSDRGGSSPAVADGKVFSCGWGQVYAFGSSATIPVTGVTLDKSTDTINTGSNDTLIATVAPADASNKAVTWSSDNDAAAAVDASGTVTGMATGTANITVTTVDGGFTATCAVTVNSTAGNCQLTVNVDPAGGGSVELNPAGGSYPAGTVVTLTASRAQGFSFDHWSGDLSGGVSLATITMDGNKSVTAHFKPETSWSLDSGGSIPWADFQGIWGSSACDIWIVGESSKTMHYDGNNWTVVGCPGTPDAWLRDVCGSSADNVWAGGNLGEAFHYDGTSWTAMPTATGRAVTAIWSSSASDVWAGDDQGVGLMHYDGNAWTTVEGTVPSWASTNDIWGTSASDVWVGCTAGIAHYDGNVWTQALANCNINGIWGTSASDVWAVGNDEPQNTIIWHYDGSVWTQVYSCPPGPWGAIGLWSIWGSSASDIWAVGGMLMHYDGSAWDQVGTGFDSSAGRIWCCPSDVWAVRWGEIIHGVTGVPRETVLHLTAVADPAGGGSVELNPAGGSYPAGTVVTLTASPAEGFSFDHWGGDLSGSASPATVTMNADKSVTAYFKASSILNDFDLNGDNQVNVLDMILVGQHFGESGSPGWISADVNKDGQVNVLDMILIGQHWG